MWVWFQLGVVSYASSPILSVCVNRKEGRVGEDKEEERVKRKGVCVLKGKVP